MAFPSGNGGYVFPSAVAGSPLIVPVGRHTLTRTSRLAEVTQSDSGGGTYYVPVVGDPKWTIELAFDDAAFPEFLGLEEGTNLDELYFRKGDSNYCDLLIDTTCGEVEVVTDNAGDVVRLRISGQGGVCSPNVGVPVIFT